MSSFRVPTRRSGSSTGRLRSASWTSFEEVSGLDDPRSRGKALTGNLTGLWRYRVGDYRVVCDIEDGRLVIVVVDLGHRSRVYKARR